MELCRLDIADYKEKALQVRYVTSYIYEAISKQGDDCFGVMFERTKLIEPLACGFDDVWCSEWLENPELFAVREAGQVIAFVTACQGVGEGAQDSLYCTGNTVLQRSRDTVLSAKRLRIPGLRSFFQKQPGYRKSCRPH